jgi:hypothetical protein
MSHEPSANSHQPSAMQQVMAGIFYAEDLLWRLEFVMIGVMMMKPWFKCQGNETSN